MFRDLKEEISDLYKWVKEFITEDIWHLDLDDFSRASARLLKYLKIAIITFKEIGHLRLGLYAVSLSFFTVMALVPFIAVSFAVTGGLGLKDTLHELLLESTGDNKQFMEYIISFANNIIESSTKDIFGIISFVIFNIENLSELGMFLRNMIGLGGLEFVNFETVYYIKNYLVILIVGIICSTPIIKNILEKLSKNSKTKLVANVLEIGGCICLLVVCSSFLISSSFNPFIYFRF